MAWAWFQKLIRAAIDKYRIVEEGNWHKFTKSKDHEELAKKLLSTGDREIVEVSLSLYMVSPVSLILGRPLLLIGFGELAMVRIMPKRTEISGVRTCWERPLWVWDSAWRMSRSDELRDCEATWNRELKLLSSDIPEALCFNRMPLVFLWSWRPDKLQSS